METKKYASYAEMDRELEILKLQKEIQFQKLTLNIQKTKESFEPQNIIKSFFGSYKATLSNSYVDILQTIIPFFIKWIINRKRGR
ncbi:DUF6327 family protein [Flavobacterium restrictum]|uniref:Uncharacterized protein n=1 Tax=Flavobacterium restrictum TaxID=2594428 RepID=A0A553E5U2_9FLAO|nr:DUF6327 family protein [Flavobacterium restrictum]TRX40370.1 hypothetical protein FNW21_06470 [Flavobacterium restrictum]